MNELGRLRPEPADEDDPGFINLCSTVIFNAVEAAQPTEVFIVKVKNWFGARWLGFSGKTLGALGVRKQDVTVPPFVPARVLEQLSFRHTSGAYEAFESPRLHRRQPSSENLQRRISLVSPGGAFFWYSSGSKKNGRGSLMGYVPTPGGHQVWYLELKENREWSVAKTVGVGKSELAALTRLNSHAVV